MNDSQDNKKKLTSKQIVAIIGIILLVLLYVVALLAAIFGNPASNHIFFAALYGTIVIPIMIWVYTWLYGKFTGKHTIADPPVASAEKESSETE